MKRNTVFAAVLAASMSLSLLTGCQTTATTTPTTAPGTSTVKVGANGLVGSTGTTTVSTPETTTGTNPQTAVTTGTTATVTPPTVPATTIVTTTAAIIAAATNMTPTSTASVTTTSTDTTTTSAPSQAVDAAADEGTADQYDAVASDLELNGSKASYTLEAVNASDTAIVSMPAATGTATLDATSADAAPSVDPTAATDTANPTPAAAHTKKKTKTILTDGWRANHKLLIAKRAAAAKRLRANEEAAVRRALNVAKWVDNGDGTETKTITKTVAITGPKGGKWSRSIALVRTVDTDTKDLVFASTDITEHFAPGGLHTLHWEKSLQDDGTYDVTLHQVRRYGKPGAGPTRRANWTKTIDTNGNVKGTGTIVWLNRKGVVVYKETITIDGQQDNQGVHTGTIKGKPVVLLAQPGEASTPDGTATADDGSNSTNVTVQAGDPTPAPDSDAGATAADGASGTATT